MPSPLTIGRPDGLEFRLEWETPPSPATCEDATWGRLAVRVRGRLVWGVVEELEPEVVSGIEWGWIDLLEHLTTHWVRLVWEEISPLGGTLPDELRREARARWKRAGRATERREEVAVLLFEKAHDLSSGLQGAWPPSLWVLRQGNEFLISAEGAGRGYHPAADVLAALEGLGTAICERLAGCPEARASLAIESWKARDRATRPGAAFVSLVTGLDRRVLDRIAGDDSLAAVFEMGEEPAATELLAAARMLGPSIPARATRAVLERIRAVPRVRTDRLDRLSPLARARLPGGEPFHAQGVALANWARRELGYSDADEAHPYAVLTRDLGVPVEDTHLGISHLDAVSVWGPTHGPCVFLNLDGEHAQGEEGRRATLAHEICHLLVDRDGALPLGEVQGGRVPRAPERRAGAFAAQFLLPRSAVLAEFDITRDARTEVLRIREKYRASLDIVAWQILNSGTPIPFRTREYLERVAKREEREHLRAE